MPTTIDFYASLIHMLGEYRDLVKYHNASYSREEISNNIEIAKRQLKLIKEKSKICIDAKEQTQEVSIDA